MMCQWDRNLKSDSIHLTQLEYFHLMQITVRVEMLLKIIDISWDTSPNKKKSYTFSLLNSKIKMRDFFFRTPASRRMRPRASLARCKYVCICSRTDIKISSFHEDSRNKDCKKVWNEPRALPRAHISRLFPFSSSVARPFLFLLLSLHLSVIPTLQGWR